MVTVIPLIAYGALAIGLVGILWRIRQWFVLHIGPESQMLPIAKTLAQTGGAILKIIFSPRIIRLLKALVWEVLLQGHILQQDWRRGLMHLGFFWGFLFLLIFHALDDFTSARLWADYNPTQNPWRFLRNLGGALILAGACLAAWRRRSEPILRRTRTAGDRLALVLLAAIILSGVLLESSQIISPTIFNTMVADYMFSDDQQEIEALQIYWQSALGAAQRPWPAAPDAKTRALGREMHEAFCAACHDGPQAAFLSYPLSRLLKPLAGTLDRIRFDTVLWYFHFLISCLGLALLPWTKFFHLVATPVSLLVRATGSAAATPAGRRPVRRAMGLDACTHCGVCSQHCAVAVIYRARPNSAILPSEKIGALKRWRAGATDIRASVALAEGNSICTACGRCTRWCPSGIDLQDLWQAADADLTQKGFPPAHDWIRSRPAAQWASRLPVAPHAVATKDAVSLGANPEIFRACVQCTVCTNVCPVVAVSENPRQDLDLTPQQVMNLMRLQLREMALGARMVWDCVTCYQCQENCPQGVRVADILYELRNEAQQRLKPEYPLRTPDGFNPKA